MVGVHVGGLRQEASTCRSARDADLVMGPTPKHRWAYACSKALDEFLALAYWKGAQAPVIIVRFFNTVGPRQTGQSAWSSPTSCVRRWPANRSRFRRRHSAAPLRTSRTSCAR